MVTLRKEIKKRDDEIARLRALLHQAYTWLNPKLMNVGYKSSLLLEIEKELEDEQRTLDERIR